MQITFVVFSLFVAVAAPQASASQVLFIGDSHSVGTFGHELDRLIRREDSTQVGTYASCGSSPYYWSTGQATACGYFQKTPDGKETSSKTSPTPILKDLIAQQKPAYVVVEQGANFIGSPQDYQESSSLELATTITSGGARCIWVGPPQSRVHPAPAYADTYAYLQNVAKKAGCVFIDSRGMTAYPATGGDGLHYDSLGPEGVKLAKKWAKGVFDAIRAEIPGWPKH